MIEPPSVVQLESRPTAVIHFRIPRDEMGEAFGSAIPELLQVLTAQGAAPAGGAFAHHFQMLDNEFDFDLGFPVTKPITASGRVKSAEWPAMRAAHTVLHGNYDGLPDAWGEFEAWYGKLNEEPAPDIWETYDTGPESSENPDDWRTGLYRPLK